MTVVPGSQPNSAQSSEERAEGAISVADFIGGLGSGSGMGMLDLVGNAMQENISSTYSAENMNRMGEFISQTLEEILEGLPAELREGLTQFFNRMTGGATDATPKDPAATAEADIINAAYGTGNHSAVTFAERDPHSFLGGATIGNGAGAILEVNGIQLARGGKPEGDDDEGVSLMQDAADAQEQAQEELRRWQEETHRMGNIEMTGEEWGEFADMLSRNTPQRRSLIDDIRRREGLSETQAQRKADEIALLARMRSIPESHWTPEMRALDAELDANPQKRQNFEDHLERANDRAQTLERASSTTQTEIRNSTDTAQSAASRAGLFASARVATEDFARAGVATEPLDARPPPARITISLPPSALPARAIPFASGGFDE